MSPFLLVLSSPSGGGKTTIARSLLDGRDDLGYSVSATTRAPRSGERDAVDYHFLTRDQFEARAARGEFLEWATYGGELYGTLRSAVVSLLEAGRHAVLDIEVQGARQVRAAMPEAVLVFVLPPSGETLVQRLLRRATEDPDRLTLRLERAAEELSAVNEYDYVVVNSDLISAVSAVAAILESECRRVGRIDKLDSVVERLRAGIISEAARIGAART